MKMCENCPNKRAPYAETSSRILPGGAKVLIDTDGGISFIRRSSNSRAIKLKIIKPSEVARNYPDLISAVETCTGPQTSEQPRPGRLGEMGLTLSVISCPALASQMDVANNDSVVEYFYGPKKPDTQTDPNI